jgi:hypothetical protein
MTKDLMNSGLLRDRYVADLFERLQVRHSILTVTVTPVCLKHREAIPANHSIQSQLWGLLKHPLLDHVSSLAGSTVAVDCSMHA